MSETKAALDKKQKILQFAHLNTEKYAVVTIPVVYDADYDQHVCVASINGLAYIKVTKVSEAAVTGEGFPIIANTYYHTIIRAGEYIASDVAVHVTSLGEAE